MSEGPNGNGEEQTATVGSLSYVLHVFGSGRSAKDLTVLADQHDPYRQDTPSNRRDAWGFQKMTGCAAECGTLNLMWR